MAAPNVPAITVVIPSRDRPTLLRGAVNSVRAQSIQPLEIIVVDEGSTPSVTSLGLSDVKVVRHDKPRGPGAARNRGAAEASGDYVAFLDDDDIWHRDKLKVVTECIVTSPEVKAVFHGMATDSNRQPDKRFGFSILELPVERMLGRSPPHPSSWTVERKTHLNVKFDEEYPAAEDLDYNVRLAQTTNVAEIFDILGYHVPKLKPSSIAVDSRIAGRRRFRSEHSLLFVEDRFERHHQLRMAHLHRRGGHRGKAMWLFVQLALAQPGDLDAWKGLAASCLPASVVVLAQRYRSLNK